MKWIFFPMFGQILFSVNLATSFNSGCRHGRCLVILFVALANSKNNSILLHRQVKEITAKSLPLPLPHRGKRKLLKMIWNLPVWIICWKSVNERHVVLNVFYWYLSLLVSWLNLPWKIFRLMVSHLKTLVYIPDDPLVKRSKLAKLITNYKLMLRQKACWPWLSENGKNYFSFIFSRKRG